MKTEEVPYHLIDLYLQGKLPRDHAFVQQLSHDVELQQEVEVQRLLTDAVIDHRLLKVQEELHALRATGSSKENKRGSSAIPKIALAVLTTAGLLSLIFFFKNDNTTAPVSSNREIPAKMEPIRTEIAEKIRPTDASRIVPIVPQVSSRKEQPNLVPTAEIKEEKVAEAPAVVTAVETEVEKHIAVPTPVVVPQAEKIEEKKILSVPEERPAVAPAKKIAEEIHSPEAPAKKKVTMQHHVFEPNRETWEVPTDMEKSGKLSIFDKNGHVAYRREFNKMEKITWDGTALTGGMLASTMYVYLIEYSDGTSEQGTVTLSY